MKHISISVFIILLMVNVTGCKKKDRIFCNGTGEYSGKVQVIKNCAGTYLRYQQKDYLVCNESVLAGYSSGSLIHSGFNRITVCGSPPQAICHMYHANEGYIEIVCISPVNNIND